MCVGDGVGAGVAVFASMAAMVVATVKPFFFFVAFVSIDEVGADSVEKKTTFTLGRQPG